MPSHLLYLHGFNSSPASVKARQTADWLAARGLGERMVCPTLPYHPTLATKLIGEHIERLGPGNITLVGSSLGGFYATWASGRYGCRAVLINPAVRPHLLLASYLGPQQNMYSGERYELRAEHTDALAQLEPAAIVPHRFWLLAETGDETLDYRTAVRYYAGARQTIIQGGDHSLQHWGELLPAVGAWAGF